MIQTAICAPEKTTIDQVADAYGISRNHLIKIVNELAHAGFLVTHRGRAGGFVLARPANRISIGDVVKFGEKSEPLVECFDPENNRCVITPVCRLSGVLAEALRQFDDVLGKYTLADICQKPELLRRHLGRSASG